MRGLDAGRLVSRARLTGLGTLVSLAALSLVPLRSNAQATAAIGTVAGRDVSVEHAVAAASNISDRTPVGNGSVVVVHSGKAQMQLTTGGTILICGPAKFTVLQSGDALTLALEFGNLHISLENVTLLETYTPFFTVSPASTEGDSREFTVGLDANGIFCARAIHGGVRLEQQLTGHLLVVPEPSERFLRGGDITPLHNPSGHCECTVTSADLSRAPTPALETANAAAGTERSTAAPVSSAAPLIPVTARQAPTIEPSSAATPTPPPSTPPPVPVPSSMTASPEASTTASTGAKVTLPALAFDYSTRTPVTIANSDATALLEESQLTPNWVFHGAVGKGPSAATTPSRNAGANPVAQAEQPRSFWSRLKHFFAGI